MKRQFFISSLLLVALSALGQDATHNYIVRRVMLDTLGANVAETVTYYDGLGRKEEVVQRRATPTGRDLVSYIARDNAGRERHVYLPSVSTGEGRYMPKDEVAQLAVDSHLDNAPFTTTEYEQSPMGRPLRQYGAGQDWRTADRSEATKYLINRNDVDSLRCRLYRVSDTRSQSDTLVNITCQGDYATGTLHALWQADEDGKATVTFTDMQGKQVLVRSISHDGGTATLHDTYMVYDDYEQLTAVLSPKAAAAMTAVGTAWSSTASDEVRGMCYLYMHDRRGRVKAKKLPGCAWQTYTRDKGGRVIYTQDGNRRRQGRRLVTLSDIFGRPVLTGLVREDDVETVDQRQVIAQYDPDSPTMAIASGLDLSKIDILSVNYYDSYDFLSNFAAVGGSALAYQAMNGYDEKYVADIPQLSARGMLTGTVTRVLGDTTLIVRSLYYDHHGNVIQTHETNVLGGADHTYSHLSFTGKPLQVMHVHTTADTTLTDVYSYTYDNMERLLTASVAHDGGTAVQLAANTYDELGRLASRQLGGTAAGLSEYAYNVRGWTTAISNPNFSQTLHYQDEFTGATPCYNGNISTMEWQARDAMMAAAPTRHHYSYSYDGLNRLTAASHGTTDAATWSGHLAVPAHCPRDYSCSYQYDSNGNLTALMRKGVSQVTTAGTTTVWQYGTIDDLSLTYDGNRLKKVADQCADLTYEGAMDFSDGANRATEYTYDANGNMTSDANKGISRITYNVLNLPQEVTFADGHIIRYRYAADGRKLRTDYVLSNYTVIDNPGGPSILHSGGTQPMGGGTFTPGGDGLPDPENQMETTLMTRDYCGNHIYRDGVLERITNDYGYWAGGNWYYHVKDYQGNVRAVIDGQGALEEVNNYYPYGGLMGGGTVGNNASVQPYKYGTKELDRQNGLDWYDSQARMYDPLLGRTPTLDPKAEDFHSFSPYIWCKGNPINRIDPYGKADYFNLKGDFIFHDDEDDYKYLVLDTSNSVEKISKSVSEGQYILAPNSEVIKRMDNLFVNSDNGSTIEQGFNVYAGNVVGDLQTGSEGEIFLNTTLNKEYDVHIHQWNGPNDMHGLAEPSESDKNEKKTKNDNTISIVLGYKKPSLNLDLRLSTSAVSQIGSQTTIPMDKSAKGISFYNAVFNIYVDYDKFKKIVTKIEAY